MENSQDEDPFDTLLNLESDHYTIGYDAGFRDGTAQSAVEGRIFGIEKGFEKFVLMGRLRYKAEVWARKFTSVSNSASGGEAQNQDGNGDPSGETATSSNANPRLERHITTLLLLTDFTTLNTSNTDDAVAEFDDRLKRAQAKVKVIERLLGKDVSSQRNHAKGEGHELQRGSATVSTGAAADIENLKLKPG